MHRYHSHNLNDVLYNISYLNVATSIDSESSDIAWSVTVRAPHGWKLSKATVTISWADGICVLLWLDCCINGWNCNTPCHYNWLGV